MMIPCPLHQLTGLDCPFCGFQRGMAALFRGDVAAWWHYNPVLWCLMPYFLVLLFAQVYRPSRQWAWVAWCCSDRVTLSVMAVLLLWGVIRNLL